MKKITFIGLGIMGENMATNLLQATNTQLTVWNRSPEPVERLVAKGAHKADSLAAAVAEADIVFTMLSTPAVVEDIAFGEAGFLDQMQENALWVDCTTVDPASSRRSAKQAQQRNIRFVGAPVAGSKPQAAKALLVFYLGGDAADVAEIEPYTSLMGQKNLHLGEHGMGSSLKMLVNGLLAQSMLAFAEAVALGEKMGLEQEMLLEVLPQLPVTAPVTQFKVDNMRQGQYPVMFPLEWMQKDLQLASEAAYEVGQPLFLINLAKEVYSQAKRSGLAREDFSAIYEFVKS
ncbi:MAG: NAD(P)-dependent oxidoreductase [Bacteroidota bacterium]